MKVLVTGANGYLGFPLTQVLMERGFEVTGLDTNFYRSGWLYNGFLELPSVVTKDIRQVTETDLTGYDAVIHLAELSNDPLGQIDPQITMEINHHGTVNLAQKAKQAGISRFIYYSSCSIYGASDEIATEDSKPNPLTAYAKCKVLNEHALKKEANSHFTPVILRNATAFGSSPRMRFDLVINNLTALAYLTQEITMESDGTPWRPFVHVLDICEAVICALKAPRNTIHSEIFNVGATSGNYQIRDIANIISAVIPKCRITFNPKGADKRNYRVNFDKISSQLPGFSAKRDVLSGVKELVDLFQKINFTKKEFSAKEFTRLKQINYLLNSGKIDSHLQWIGKASL